MNILIVGCSRRKTLTVSPTRAIDLYQGGCFPSLRTRIEFHRELESRIFILSGRYGLLSAHDVITPYDCALTLERAEALRPVVSRAASDRILIPFSPSEVLAVIEPLYFVMIADFLTISNRPTLHWIANPATGWSGAEAILDTWGWPR